MIQNGVSPISGTSGGAPIRDLRGGYRLGDPRPLRSTSSSASGPSAGGASGCIPSGPVDPRVSIAKGKQVFSDLGVCDPRGPDPALRAIEGWTLVSSRCRPKHGLATGAPSVHACRPRHGDGGPQSGGSFSGKASDRLPPTKGRQSRLSSLQAALGKTPPLPLVPLLCLGIMCVKEGPSPLELPLIPFRRLTLMVSWWR